MMLVAIFIPWLSFFLRGKIITGIICFILQITLIGWIPAAIWAVASRSDSKNLARMNQMEKRITRSYKNSSSQKY